MCHLHALRANETAALFEIVGVPKRSPITARGLNKIGVCYKLATVCKSQTSGFCVKVQPIGGRQALLKLHFSSRGVVQNAQHLSDGQGARTGRRKTAKLIGFASRLHRVIKAQSLTFFGFVIGQILQRHAAWAFGVLAHFLHQSFGHGAILQGLRSALGNVAHDCCQLGIFQNMADGKRFALSVVKIRGGHGIVH